MLTAMGARGLILEAVKDVKALGLPINPMFVGLSLVRLKHQGRFPKWPESTVHKVAGLIRCPLVGDQLLINVIEGHRVKP